MRTVLFVAVAACLAGQLAVAGPRQTSGGPIYQPGDGVTAPVVVTQVRPQYTAEAMRAKIQGTVALECVVETDGSVRDVTVTRSLDEGLDQEAVKALRRWTFKPGTREGKAVRVRIGLEMTFALK